VTAVSRGWRRVRRRVHALGRERAYEHPDLAGPTPEDRHYLTSLYDERAPLPPGAERELSPDNPRLQELRRSYEALALPVGDASRWRDAAVKSFLDLRYFRGETLFYWHYRELPRVTALKYFVLLRYVAERDEAGLLGKMVEDGAFGCWTFEYPGYGRVSRDLLESANEISFLERELDLSRRGPFSVLDIGAGYGRLAHRMAEVYPQLEDYCCVDAIPESTFISEYYLRYRGSNPPARVVRLDSVDDQLRPGTFDLAVNIHSFSECTHAAVHWWVDLLARLRVRRLLVIPNEPNELLTLEPDGSRRDFRPLLEAVGYRAIGSEPVIADAAVRELLPLSDSFFLFALKD
jgi:SAM-dependent methyltransferase